MPHRGIAGQGGGVGFAGVGQLLGAQAFTGGQLAGISAGQQDAERRRQQEFLNFFRVQQAQQQAGQFQEQQAFRQAMFERQGLQQERQFGLAERRFGAQERFRTGQLNLQALRLFGERGIPQEDISDLLGPRLTEQQQRIDEVQQLRLQQRRELAQRPSGVRAAPQPRLFTTEELAREDVGVGAIPQPDLGIPGVRPAQRPIAPTFAPRRGRRGRGLSRIDIIKLASKALEGDRASQLILANAGIDFNTFGNVTPPALVSGAKDALKALDIDVGKATQGQIRDALQAPLSDLARGFETFKAATLPFGVDPGVNILRERTGFTQPLLTENIQELERFLRDIERAPEEVQDVQATDQRFALQLRDRLLQFQSRFARAEEFGPPRFDISGRGPELPAGVDPLTRLGGFGPARPPVPGFIPSTQIRAAPQPTLQFGR